jgi:hypothetical protein
VVPGVVPEVEAASHPEVAWADVEVAAVVTNAYGTEMGVSQKEVGGQVCTLAAFGHP